MFKDAWSQRSAQALAARRTCEKEIAKVQQDILQDSQSWMNSLQAKAHHAMTGTWFSDEQRKQIAKAALEAIQEKKKALNAALSQNPSGGGVENWVRDATGKLVKQ